MICAVLLAAGTSTRMGSANKLLLEFGGQPLVRHMAERLVHSDVDEVVAVTGFDEAEVCHALQGLRVRIIHNPEFEKGMSTTVKCGVRSIAEDADFMICLSDMPLLQSAHYSLLTHTFRQAVREGRTPIVRPASSGGVGNPVVFHHAFRADVLRMPDGNFGCKPVVSRYLSQVVELEETEDVYYLDMDQPAAYLKMKKRENGV